MSAPRPSQVNLGEIFTAIRFCLAGPSADFSLDLAHLAENGENRILLSPFTNALFHGLIGLARRKRCSSIYVEAVDSLCDSGASLPCGVAAGPPPFLHYFTPRPLSGCPACAPNFNSCWCPSPCAASRPGRGELRTHESVVTIPY
jgi:hypothetical protein